MLRVIAKAMLGLLVWMGFAGLAGAHAPAEPSVAPTEADIVVRAQQEDAIREFVASVTEAGRSGQLGRWSGEICPSVIGIDRSQADFMTLRIGEVAAPLELRVRTRNCSTSMLIIVTNEAARFATHFARLYPITLRADGQAKLNLFAHTGRPVRWISVTDLCGVGCSQPNTRILRATHPEFRAMLVIVDARQIGGFSLGEVSDYVAMVALANPRPGARDQASILSMFDRPRPADGPFALTQTDRSFLVGLYRSNPHQSAGAQRASIETHMRRDGSQ